MANIVRSLGYSLGKVHCGLINYLYVLHQEGNREPLESFLSALGVRVPFSPRLEREWKSVDLAIFDHDRAEPSILIEIKVHDHEGGFKMENYQTVRYASKWPSCDAYLFVTLGIGEYYHAPRSNRFSWVRIRKFQKALEVIKTRDSIIEHWLDEIRREIDLQDRAARIDKSRIGEYRPKTNWNIYLFGHLAEMIEPQLRKDHSAVEMTCGCYGSRPDTIMNFGRRQEPFYMEINYNGKLNLKMSFDKEPAETKRDIVQKAIDEWKQVDFGIAPSFHALNKIGDTKTIASFDVGLLDKDGFIEYKHSLEDTKQRLLSVLDKFYGRLNAPLAA